MDILVYLLNLYLSPPVLPPHLQRHCHLPCSKFPTLNILFVHFPLIFYNVVCSNSLPDLFLMYRFIPYLFFNNFFNNCSDSHLGFLFSTCFQCISLTSPSPLCISYHPDLSASLIILSWRRALWKKYEGLQFLHQYHIIYGEALISTPPCPKLSLGYK